jgi:hypothetical protein
VACRTPPPKADDAEAIEAEVACLVALTRLECVNRKLTAI